VAPIGSTVLHEASCDSGAGTRIHRETRPQAHDFVMRMAQRQMHEPLRVQERQGRLPKGIEQAFESRIGSTAAVGMAAHPIDHHE